MKYFALFKTFIIWGICSFIIVNSNFAQVETVPAENPVYSFLKEMHLKGVLKKYDDTILPLSRKIIVEDILIIDNNKSSLSNVQLNYLMKLKTEFLPEINTVNYTSDFPSTFFEKLADDSQKHIYSYNDSLVNFYLDPVFQLKSIYSDKEKSSASFLNLGGTFYGSYDDWLGFLVQGSNAVVWGDRKVALNDKNIAQSYSFNHTSINYFDGTKGYMRLEKGAVNLEIGRERILWGNGYLDRTILSDNPQLFDFIKFNFSYKKLRYDFIHGWLVQQPTITYIDSLIGNVKSKSSKYVAISRLGFNATNNLNFGITQMIIYSGRPFELAYLNPFLFWESAQRSMNDLDNSFLSFDGRYLLTNGLEVSSSIIFDDIDFKLLFQGHWNRNNNGVEWQTGMMLTNPILPNDLKIKLEYLQARPYIFSHPGIGEALTYTNNGYLLGADMQPNSSRISAEVSYRFSSNFNFSLKYIYSLHGDNIYDSSGNRILNVGGNVFESLTLYDPEYVNLLDGIRKTEDKLQLNFNYEINYGTYLNAAYIFKQSSQNGNVERENIAWLTLQLIYD